VLKLFEEKNVILNMPIGSGKSLVAMALHFTALAHPKVFDVGDGVRLVAKDPHGKGTNIVQPDRVADFREAPVCPSPGFGVVAGPGQAPARTVLLEVAHPHVEHAVNHQQSARFAPPIAIPQLVSCGRGDVLAGVVG
jgi:hypothetical protein